MVGKILSGFFEKKKRVHRPKMNSINMVGQDGNQEGWTYLHLMGLNPMNGY